MSGITDISKNKTNKIPALVEPNGIGLLIILIFVYKSQQLSESTTSIPISCHDKQQTQKAILP